MPLSQVIHKTKERTDSCDSSTGSLPGQHFFDNTKDDEADYDFMQAQLSPNVSKAKKIELDEV